MSIFVQRVCDRVFIDPFWLHLRNSLRQKGFGDPALPILIKNSSRFVQRLLVGAATGPTALQIHPSALPWQYQDRELSPGAVVQCELNLVVCPKLLIQAVHL